METCVSQVLFTINIATLNLTSKPKSGFEMLPSETSMCFWSSCLVAKVKLHNLRTQNALPQENEDEDMAEDGDEVTRSVGWRAAQTAP
jgi:hypothetical protein